MKPTTIACCSTGFASWLISLNASARSTPSFAGAASWPRRRPNQISAVRSRTRLNLDAIYFAQGEYAYADQIVFNALEKLRKGSRQNLHDTAAG
jgi:hypothetical protein